MSVVVNNVKIIFDSFIYWYILVQKLIYLKILIFNLNVPIHSPEKCDIKMLSAANLWKNSCDEPRDRDVAIRVVIAIWVCSMQHRVTWCTYPFIGWRRNLDVALIDRATVYIKVLTQEPEFTNGLNTFFKYKVNILKNVFLNIFVNPG
jgi:hypothetical protein